MMIMENEVITLSTGRTIAANREIVGISGDGLVTEGYDGVVADARMLPYVPDDEKDEPTKEELIELAGIMVSRWLDFRNRLQAHG